MAAARKKSVVRKAAKGLLKAVEGLHPTEALERLASFVAVERPGLRRRALLAARIALMRRALVEPVPAAEVPVMVPEPVVAEMPEPAPKPKAPKPLSKGTMMAVSLEDAAKLLMVSPEPEPEEETEGPTETAEFVAKGWADAAAQINAAPEGASMMDGSGGGGTVILDDLDAAVASLSGLEDDSALFPDEAAPAPGPTRKGGKGKGKGQGKTAGSIGDDMEALAAFATVPQKGTLPAGLDADLAALAALDDMTAAAVSAEPPVGLVDPAAGFAELAAAEENEARALMPPAKASAVDQAAALAALDELGPVVILPPAPSAMVDPTAAFAALAEVEDPDLSKPRAKPVVDARAVFAALEAAQDEEAKAIAPAGKPKPLAIDLTAQFAAMGRDGEA